MKLRASLALCFFIALCIALSQPVFAADLISGKVVETMNSGGYSYVCLEKDGSKTWVAVPQMEITMGSQMSFTLGMEMTDFQSKTLKRKFDRIIFSGGPASPAEAAAVQSHAGKKDTVADATEQIKVEKASGANAYTIAELYAKSADLAGKAVTVKGKVVKFSSGIMDKNWIHLQDGSGEQEKGNNDLVVTTKDELAAGDIVTVSGNLGKDKDFGFGYKYSVIIEDAATEK
ncbi:MAG: OB-fold nucleic acid binding domain-containing protein [Thermodesulfovibrionales bacterium]|jgi:hypothetical protein